MLLLTAFLFFGLPGCFSACLIDFRQLLLRSCLVLCVTFADLVVAAPGQCMCADLGWREMTRAAAAADGPDHLGR